MKLYVGAVGLVTASCAFSFHSSGLHTSSSSSSTSASSDASAAPAASKRGGGDEAPGVGPALAGAPQLAKLAATAAPAAWTGTYDTGDEPSCDGAYAPLDPRGPDVQTIRAAGWNYSPGFRCPGSCQNPAKVTIANGKLTFPLVWVDDRPPQNPDGSVAITMHRYQIEVPVNASATYASAPFDWAHNNTPERGNGVRVANAVDAMADVHAGTGRFVEMKVSIRDVAPGAPEYEWVSDPAGCDVTYYRSDFKTGDGLFPDAGGDGGGGDDGDRGDHGRGDASSARRSCKSACKEAAGACRTACHGSSAQCANDCNHTESSCTPGC